MAGTEEVLIAAADGRLRGVISRLFERAGFETSEVGSGEGALSSAKRARPPSLVILDLELEDMSGYEVCFELREELGDGLPILFLSQDRTEPQDRVAGLLIGADDYLTRPFDPDELLVRHEGSCPAGPSGSPRPRPSSLGASSRCFSCSPTG